MHPRANGGAPAPLSPKAELRGPSPRHSPRLDATRPMQNASARLGALQAHPSQVPRDPSRQRSDPRPFERGAESGYAEFDAAPAAAAGFSQTEDPATLRRAASFGARMGQTGPAGQSDGARLAEAYPAMADARARAFPPEKRPLHAGAGPLHFGLSQTEVPRAYKLFETQHQREMDSLKQQIEEAQARAVPSSMKASSGLRRIF